MQEQSTAQRQRYSTGAVVLHWLLALCLSFELALGFAMPRDASGFALFQLHKSVGITILVLSLVRLAWRMTHTRPPAAETGLTGALASGVHFGFYAFMILGPLTGWAVASTAPVQIPTILFGVVPLAHLPLPSGLNGLLLDAHTLLAWIGLGLFLLHIAGALRHHVLLRDGLMQRMAPAGSTAVATTLAILVILVAPATLLVAGGSAPLADGMQRTAVAGVAIPDEAPVPRERTASEQEPPEVPAVSPAEADESESQQSASEAEPDEPAAPGPPPTWTIQPGGRLGFSVEDGSGGRVRGTFGKWGGSIHFDPDNPESAEIRIDVDLASASVGDPTQDAMLAGEEFLATATRSTATFRTTSVRRTGSGRYSAQGTLELRGVSRPQSLTFTLEGEGLRRRVEGTATLDRTVFGIGTGSAAASVGRNVSVDFAFDAQGRGT